MLGWVETAKTKTPQHNPFEVLAIIDICRPIPTTTLTPTVDQALINILMILGAYANKKNATDFIVDAERLKRHSWNSAEA